MRFSRLLIFLLAAGLPLAVSMTWSVDPLAPKTALWMMTAGFLLVIPAPLALPVGPLLLALGLAAAGTLHGPASPWPLLPLLAGTICFLRVRETADAAFILRYLRLTTSVAALVASYGVSQAVFNQLHLGVHLINPFGERVLSTLGNPTFFADYLALHLPLALALWERAESPLAAGGWTAAIGAITTGLVLTGSKGGQLAGAAGAAAWVLLAPHPRRPSPERIVVLAGLIIAGAATLAATTASPSAALARWTEQGQRYSFSQRLGMLEGAAAMWRKAPLLGSGPGQFPIRFPRHMPAALQKTYGVTLSVNHAHNDYAELACDLGIVGAGLILFVLFAPVRRIAEGGWPGALAAAQIAVGVSMATNFVLFLPSSAFFAWTHAGLLHGPAAPGPIVSPRARQALWILALYLVLAGGRLMVATGEFHFGAEAMDRSDAPTAIRYLTRTVALTPTDRHPWQYLGRAHEFLEDWDGAIDAYNRALALAPWHAITSLNVGRAERSRYLANRLLHFPSRGRAMAALLRCVAANGYAVEPRVWGGDLAVRAGRFDYAQQFFGDTPPDLVPTPGWHRARVEWLSALGNGAGARHEKEAADRLEARQLADAADAAAAGGRMDEAIRYARDATARFPREVRGWETLGYLLHGQGDLTGARAAYQHMATLLPNSITAHLDLAVIALNSHDLAGAERYLNKAVAISPDAVEVHLTLARLRAAQNRRAEAVREYEWVLTRAPGHPQATEELKRLR